MYSGRNVVTIILTIVAVDSNSHMHDHLCMFMIICSESLTKTNYTVDLAVVIVIGY